VIAMMIDVDDLTVVFGRGLRSSGHKALDHVSFRVEEGDSFALLGPNGAGKSTTLYCILGLLSPTSGSARVLGQLLEPGSPLFRDIAFVPEEPHFHDYLTVEEAVRYYAALHGEVLPPARLTAVLEELRLETARTTVLSACSKGMKQKVGIARCLLRPPRLLVLDEPMRGLDPASVKQFRDVLIDLNRRGATIVMNSHQLSEVEQVATRAAILSKGRLLAVKPLAELTREEKNVYAIEIEGLGPLPDYLTVDRMTEGSVRGTVSAEHLYEFMELARASGAAVRSCVIKKYTLEESFLATLSESERGRV
jgi:ABC-2 type transport system ATP-binding protein